MTTTTTRIKTKRARMFETLAKNKVRGLTVEQIKARAGYATTDAVRSVIYRENGIVSFRPKAPGAMRYRLAS